MKSPSREVVTVSLVDLIHYDESNQELLDKIGQAFGNGPECLGILVVTDIPAFAEMRQRLLPLSRRLAALDNLLDMERPEAFYTVGWSHGKEIFAGKTDTGKGSFYANPLVDNLAQLRAVNPDVAKSRPAFFAPNVWPSSSLPELEPAFKELGQLMVDIGRLLARPCDDYVFSKCPGYQKNKLQTVLGKSMFHKGRLLHYFANDSIASTDSIMDVDSWCGWHNDNSSLTGLVPGMYFDASGHQIECQDAGLYIQSRDGAIFSVELPHNSLAFQVGETTQVHTGGILQATPHAVKGTALSGVTRESFAVFIEPEYDDDMELPEGRGMEEVQDCAIPLPSSVRPLKDRWCLGQTFGDFSEATFAAFH